ncbi:SMC-Scp complex subunit ScpB [Candidatus Parcubacteria bacterium 4484_255]|nr:MAG: SMC-Scp complex subunit ScpB [Candidatus Parcubacteria bacterium 4484_255]
MNYKELKSNIESLLFIASRPIDKKEIAKNMGQSVNDLEEIFNDLIQEYKDKNKGINIVNSGQTLQMVTNPQNSEYVQKFLKTETCQELTPASLETLSIIAYRGPLTKIEIEKIRGINCSVILRRLLVKGLITEKSANKARVNEGQIVSADSNIYSVSVNFIKHLGINDVQELPDYERLNKRTLNEEDDVSNYSGK